MQTFDTAEGRHQFTVDGADYYLTPFGFPEMLQLGELANVTDQTVQVDQYRQFIAAHARTTRHPLVSFLTGKKSPAAAILSLQPTQLTTLFAAWSGAPVGESSGSQSPDSVIDAN